MPLVSEPLPIAVHGVLEPAERPLAAPLDDGHLPSTAVVFRAWIVRPMLSRHEQDGMLLNPGCFFLRRIVGSVVRRIVGRVVRCRRVVVGGGRWIPSNDVEDGVARRVIGAFVELDVRWLAVAWRCGSGRQTFVHQFSTNVGHFVGVDLPSPPGRTFEAREAVGDEAHIVSDDDAVELGHEACISRSRVLVSGSVPVATLATGVP